MGRILSRGKMLGGAIALIAVAAAGAVWLTRGPMSAPEPSAVEYPLRGVDLSAHNGTVDFEAVRDAGYSFVILKATEGAGFKDREFTAGYREARRAGLHVGAYHFFRFDRTGYMQAINILHSLRGKRLDFPLILDVEEWGNPSNPATSEIITQLRVLIQLLESHGHEVMIYTNKDGFKRFVAGRLEQHPLWICDLSGAPEQRGWRMWQFTHRGTVPGVKGHVDVNVINPK